MTDLLTDLADRLFTPHGANAYLRRLSPASRHASPGVADREVEPASTGAPSPTHIDLVEEARSGITFARSGGGAPAEGTLRFRRALRKGLKFEADITLSSKAARPDDCWKCLALCCLALRRGGTARTRGAGKLRCTLDGDWAGTVRAAGLEEGAQ